MSPSRQRQTDIPRTRISGGSASDEDSSATDSDINAESMANATQTGNRNRAAENARHAEVGWRWVNFLSFRSADRADNG